uniref:Synaptotagmin-4-like isoform X3 n=1 Tax=Nicotiana tabacum TaxID=4097 RepID=A0A1S4DPB0_TOBAC|nr:PREDICTED: synaptotagmin-4-like isoform X3 [Nicotiana tabacum]
MYSTETVRQNSKRKLKMGLISGILMGMIFGVGLMAAWKHMMRYRSTKRISKAVEVKLMGSLNRDDLKKMCGDNFPEWISFPVYEQVKWLNKQLSKLWPFVAEAAEAIIKESVEPLLEDYRPPGITSLKFSKLSLGTVAPKIEASFLGGEMQVFVFKALKKIKLPWILTFDGVVIPISC